MQLLTLSNKDKNELNNHLDRLLYSSRVSKIKDNTMVELSIKRQLWGVLAPKLDELYFDDLVKLYDMSYGIYTMDKIDWDIAIGFELIGVSMYQSENIERKFLLDYLERLKKNSKK